MIMAEALCAAGLITKEKKEQAQREIQKAKVKKGSYQDTEKDKKNDA